MIGDTERVVTPPADFWTHRPATRESAPVGGGVVIEIDPAWDELVAWFEQFNQWCELVDHLEGANR